MKRPHPRAPGTGLVGTSLSLVVLLAACGGPPALSPLPAGDAARPDVIIVSIDTLRADHLGAYGYSRDTTPRIDAVAARGVRFANAWSPAPWTLPSHATMLTGLLPLRHGAIEGDVGFDEKTPRLPVAFREQGYATVGVVSSWFVSHKHGFSIGFDRFDDFGMNDEKDNFGPKQPHADQVFGKALELAAEVGPGKPVFAFVHVYDAHYPYDAPSPWDRKFDRPRQRGDFRYKSYDHYLRNPVPPEQLEHQIAQYDEEIAYTDDQLGRFLDAWTKHRDAIVVITSDHGEEFGERGSWGHAHTLWPEQLHVPLIIAGPGIEPRVIDDRVGTLDLAATVAGLAGVPFPAGDGVDRSAQVRTGAAPSFSGVPAQLGETSRFRTLKLRWHDPPYDLYVDVVRGGLKLCDLASDPKCTTDVAERHYDTAVAMEQAMWAWLGEPWQVVEPGTLESNGFFVVGGQVVEKRLVAKAGATFLVWPPDATLTWRGTTGRDAGPYRIDGGRKPGEGDPVRYVGDVPHGAPVTVLDHEMKALEALGYVQE